MNVAKRITAILLTALLLMLSAAGALAEAAVYAGFAVEGNDNVYVVMPDDGNESLYSVPSSGGDLSLIESCAQINNLVMQDDILYYIRYKDSAYQIARMDESGLPVLHTEFSVGTNEKVTRLSWYDDVLYCLVAGKLTIVDPSSGDAEELSEVQMDDYVIVNDVIYYISSTDRLTYQRAASTEGGSDMTVSAGTLYNMSLNGTNPEKVLNIGMTDLKAQGDYLYFRNYEDNYPMGGADNTFLMGRLYRYNLQTNQASSMDLSYEWDFYPTPGGLIVYTKGDISVYPLTGGAPVHLMTPQTYTTIYAYGDNVYVYETIETEGVLTRLPVNGLQALQLVGGAPLVDETGAVIDDGDFSSTEEDPDENIPDENIEDENWTGDEDETTPTPKPTKTPKPTATPKPTKKATDSSYIFKDSNKKKLTRSRILEVDKKLWAYARNEIYARHGYVFKTKKYADYFAKKSWYKPGGFSTSDLNSTEWYNMDLLKAMEDEYGVGSGSSSGSSGSSGSNSSGKKDSSYIFKDSHKKKLTEAQIKKVDKKWWPYARNEIYARHGYVFKTKKYADYFAKKSWYKPGGFSTSDLSDIEWYNMELIKKMEDKS